MKRAVIRIGAILILLGLVIVVPRSPVAAEWVEFNSAGTPPTPFQLKRAKAQGIELEPKPGTPLRGLLFKPEGSGTFPAVVLLHGCRGIEAYQKNWAENLSYWGYVALLVDSFGPRKVENLCSVEEMQSGKSDQMVGAQVADAVGAHAHLARLSEVDAKRIAVMGWAEHAVLSVVFEGGTGQLYEADFRAAVSFYPDCRGNLSGRFKAPALMLIGGQDDSRRPDYCERAANAGKALNIPVELKIYPGAYHGFDDSEMRERFVMKNAWNIYKNPPHGVTFEYNREAHEDAQMRVRDFLAVHLNK